MSRSPSSNPSQNNHSHVGHEMHPVHSTPSGQENLLTHMDQTTTKGNKSQLWSPILNFRLLFGLLWIAPIICLLWLNFSKRVIGGTAWCLKKPCGVIQYDSYSDVTTNSLIDKYDKANHNLLSALQFAAKALEVWFMYSASSLVYLVAYTLAQRPGGLPTAHFLTHLEYADLLWLRGLSLFRTRGVECRRAVVSNSMHKAHLYLFTLLVASMCIIANLIGPSIAVLMLPTVRWQESKHFNESYFVQLEADSPPAGDLTPGCTAENLRKSDYTCFEKDHKNDIDAMIIGDAVIIDKAANAFTVSPNTVVLYEGILPFIYNTSIPDRGSKEERDTFWIPSRQVLRSLSNDFVELEALSYGSEPRDPSYTERFETYNNSLSLFLQRQGPIIGMQASVDYGNLTTITIDSGREVLCYQWEWDSETTKCFGALQGWNQANKNYTIATFTILDNANGSLPIKMRIYWSDRIREFLSTSSEPCLRNSTACDYDTFLPDDYPGGLLVMELSQPTSPNPESVWVAMFKFSYGFATYIFDATRIFPNIQNVIVPKPPQPNETSYTAFNPAWVLAAWGINPGGNLSSNRDAVFKFQESAQAVLNGEDDNRDWFSFIGALYDTIVQAASLVPFRNSTIRPPQTDERHVLWANIKQEVWGWKIESRTSKLGVGVAISGILTVLVRTGLLIITQEKKRGSTEIIAAALQHRYHDEFGPAVKVSELASVRYQIRTEKETGKLRFIPA